VTGAIEDIIAIGQGFRIQDLFDIIIISTLLYVLLIWFKDTASRFVFAGISLLGAIYIAARIFHLYLTSMVLQGFFAILLIALVVIFQEDIRRFFERLATWRSLRKSHSRTAGSDLPEEITVLIESVAEFASKRIGAIFVIQGVDHLERHLKGGYELDGIMSQPILESIFDEHSIGHDGAVIINDNRIVKFGCHLPLTLNTEKIGKQGLRHTAALGLTERTDALCVVVSEERGSISVAQEGKIRQVKNTGELNKIINKYYKEKAPMENPKIPFYWVRRNTIEKGVAVMLAMVLWVTFGFQRESIRRDFVVPIEYRKISQEWEIEETRYNEAMVTLMGPDQAFSLFEPSTLKISVDLSSLIDGRQEINLSPDTIKIPSNLSLIKIHPDKINITAHKMYPADIPIYIKTIGSLPKGHILQSITITPKNVSIIAPKKTLNNKVFIKTEPIDLSRLTESTTMDVKIEYPPDVYFKSGHQPAAKVDVEIVKIP